MSMDQTVFEKFVTAESRKQKKTDHPKETQKNTSSTPEVLEERLCSYCFFCGQEFETFHFESHGCVTHYFDISDNNSLAQESPSKESTLETKQKDDGPGNNAQAAKDAATKSCPNVTESRVAGSTQKNTQPQSTSSQPQSTSVQLSQSVFDEPSVVVGKVKESPNDLLRDKVKPLVDSTQEKNNITTKHKQSLKPATKLAQCPQAGSTGLNQPSAKFDNIRPESSQIDDELKTHNDKSKGEVSKDCGLSDSRTMLISESTVVQDISNSFQKVSPPEANFCEFCGLKLSSLQDQKFHKQGIHVKEHFLCFICGKMFNDTCELMFHHKIKHYDSDARKAELDYFNNTTEKTKSKYRYYCNQCGQGYDLIHALLSHKREFIKLGSHFLEDGLKAIGLLSENKQKKIAKVISDTSKKITNGSTDKKRKEKSKYDTDNLVEHREVDNKTSKQAQETPKNTNSSKEQTRAVDQILPFSRDKINKDDKANFTHASKRKCNADIKIQQQRDNQITDRHNSSSLFNTSLNHSERSDKNKNKLNKKQTLLKYQSKSEKEIPTIPQDFEAIAKHKQITENEKESNAKPGDKISSSKNKNTKKKEEIDVLPSSEREKEKSENKQDDKHKSENLVTHQKIFHHQKIMKNKQDVIKENSTNVKDSSNPEESELVLNFVDEIEYFEEEPVQDKTHKYTKPNLERRGIKKDLKIKHLYVLLKRENIESRAGKITGKCDKIIAEDNKAKRKTDQAVKETRGDRSSNNTTSKTESLLKIKQIRDRKRENTVRNSEKISLETTHSQVSNKIKKTSNTTNSNEKQDLKKTNNAPKVAERIIQECDIFSVNDNMVTQPKKGLKQFVAQKSNADIMKKPKEIAQEVKKRLSLQQYKQMRIVPNQPPVNPINTTPLIISRPQISAQAMEIINEVSQKIEIYNTLQGNNSEGAQFSDDAESESESSEEKVPTVFCEACGSECLNTNHLREHMAFMHPGFHFVCFVCDHHFSTLDAVINHQVKYTKNILMAAESQFLRLRKSMPNMLYPYYCNHCGKGFTLIDLVALHKKKAHDKQVKTKARKAKSRAKHVAHQNKEEEPHTSTIHVTSAQQETSRQNSLDVNEDQTTIGNTTGQNECQNAGKTLDSHIDNISNGDQQINSLNKDDDEILFYQETMIDNQDETVTKSPSNALETGSSDPNFPRFCECCGQKHLSFTDQQKDFHLEKFKCIICSSSYQTIDLLVAHYDRHPKQEVANLEYARIAIQKNYHYYCKFCGKGFYFIDNLIDHRKCEHFKLLQKEKDNRSTAQNNENSSELTQIQKQDSILGNKKDTFPYNSCKEVQNVKSLDEIQDNIRDQENIQNNGNLASPIYLSDTPICHIDSDKDTSKNHNLIDPGNVSIISDSDSDSSSLIIDLENISSSEESEEDGLSNFVDVEEFIKEKQMNTHVDNQKNNVEKPNVVESVSTFANLNSQDWDEVTKQLADEVSLMAAENLLENSQDEKAKELVDNVALTAEEIRSENCPEERGRKQLVDGVSLMPENNFSENYHEDAEPLSEKVPLTAKEIVLENFHEDVVGIQASIHVSLQQTDSKTETTPIFCEACGLQFLNKSNAKHHFIHNHDHFRCSVCNQRFTVLAKLIQHQDFKYKLSTLEYAEKHSLRLLLSREIPKHFRYYCNLCGKGFNLTYDLKAHKEFSCPKGDVSGFQDSSSETIDTRYNTFFNTSDMNISENYDLNIPHPSETPRECSSKNETLFPTAQKPENVKSINTPTTSTLTETKGVPTCNSCGKNFLYWHLLNEHRVRGCSSENSQHIKPIKEETKSSGSVNLIHVNTNIAPANGGKDDVKGFAHSLESTEHELTECPIIKPTLRAIQLADTPQTSPGTSKISFSLHLLQTAIQGSSINFEQAVSNNVNFPTRPPAKTFKCPVCPHRVFVSKQAIEQHLSFSQKHIKNTTAQKKELSGLQTSSFNGKSSVSQSRNLPITSLTSKVGPALRNQSGSSSGPRSYLEIPRRKNSSEHYDTPSRARSRSPPRSRKRTELSDLRRKSIEREAESKESEDKSKKKKKKSKKRKRKISENDEQKVKRFMQDYCAESTVSSKKEKNSKHRNVESYRRRRKNKGLKHKHIAHNIAKKQPDDLEGIYTLKEVAKICP